MKFVFGYYWLVVQEHGESGALTSLLLLEETISVDGNRLSASLI